MGTLGISNGHNECNSCKRREKALAGCNDCARFLCTFCVNLHKVDSFFKPHTVVTLEQFIYKHNTKDGFALSKLWKEMALDPASPPCLRQPIFNFSQLHIQHTFGTLGAEPSQFNTPRGICQGLGGQIVVADTNNHRIQVFDSKTGELCLHFGASGHQKGQLWHPHKVVVMPSNGNYIVCDGDIEARIHIFSKHGYFINAFDIFYCIYIVVGLAINRHNEIVVLERGKCSIYCFTQDSSLKKWFCCDQLVKRTSDLAIRNDEYFVCDSDGHCVVVFNDLGRPLRIIRFDNVIQMPSTIDVSSSGNVFVAALNGHRVCLAMFSIDGAFIDSFECPRSHLSSLCGLKITDDCNVIIADKENHHVLVCNTYSHAYIKSIVNGLRELKGGLLPPYL